jgi:hypothetical protein
MTEPQVAGLAGHLLAITGPSSERLLERAPRPGALSPAALIRGIQSGAFETRAMTERDWRRALAATARQDITSPLTPVQIKEMNAHFDALHRGLPRANPK